MRCPAHALDATLSLLDDHGATGDPVQRGLPASTAALGPALAALAERPSSGGARRGAVAGHDDGGGALLLGVLR